MSRVEEILEAYEAWDSERESSTELAKRLGISKARLYQILDKEGVTPKARRPREAQPEVAYLAGWAEDANDGRGALQSDPKVAYLRVEGETSVLDEITQRGIRSLLDELENLRHEVTEYRKRYGPLNP